MSVIHLLLIIACLLAGNAFVAFTGFIVPGPVVGMVFLLLILFGLGRVPDKLATTAQHLLKWMSLFFVPAGVGAMTLSATFQLHWAALVVSLIISTTLSMIVTGKLLEYLKSITDNVTDNSTENIND